MDSKGLERKKARKLGTGQKYVDQKKLIFLFKLSSVQPSSTALDSPQSTNALFNPTENVEDVNTIGCESTVGEEEEEEIEGLGEQRRRKRDEVEYSDLASRSKSKRLSGVKRREREVVTDNKNRHSVHKRQRVICERNSNNRSTNGNEEEHTETINQQGRRNSQKTTEQGLDSDGEEKEAVENESDFDSWDLPQEEEDMVLVETEPNTVSWLPEQEHDMGGFFLSSLPAFDALLTMQGPPTLGFFMSSVLGYTGLPLLL